MWLCALAWGTSEGAGERRLWIPPRLLLLLLTRISSLLLPRNEVCVRVPLGCFPSARAELGFHGGLASSLPYAVNCAALQVEPFKSMGGCGSRATGPVRLFRAWAAVRLRGHPLSLAKARQVPGESGARKGRFPSPHKGGLPWPEGEEANQQASQATAEPLRFRLGTFPRQVSLHTGAPDDTKPLEARRNAEQPPS